MNHIDNIRSVTMPITLDMLPSPTLWEQDGSCWRADVDEQEAKGWRWFPLNWSAFAKGEPQGELSEFPPGVLERLTAARSGG